MNKKSPVIKVFIWIALIAICITVISPFVMYFMPSDAMDCDEGYVRDSAKQDCVVIEDVDNEDLDNGEGEIEDAEACEAAGKTWYAENNVCI